MPNYSTSVWWRSPSGIALLLFLAIITFFLVTEHWAHIIPSVPWLLLFGCLLIHIFMHRAHGGHEGHERHDGSHRDNSQGR